MKYLSSRQWLLVPALTVLGLLLASCASDPAPRSAPQQSDNVGLYGRLSKTDTQYAVTNICRDARIKLQNEESRYPACAANIEQTALLYFDLTTLEPVGQKFASCTLWGADEKVKEDRACEEHKDIYKTDVAANVLMSPITAMGFVFNLGTKMVNSVSLDEEAFQREIEKALPTPRRLALLEEERVWRQGFPARERAEIQQQKTTRENARRLQAEENQIFQDQVRLAQTVAENKFAAKSATSKTVGETVCSTDNRLGYVEQVSGSRIKVLIKGRAIASRNDTPGLRDRNPLGPFKLDTSGLSGYDTIGRQGADIEVPVIDSHYLFKAHQTVRIGASSSGQIWDDATFWGACDWRF